MKRQFLICILIIAMAAFPSFSMDIDLQNYVTPYRLMRFLQRAFDDVVRGNYNHKKSISELVEETGTQLRATNMDVFLDNRNVDAVLMYTIISGNSSILEYLVTKDKHGYFNSDVVHALRQYFMGQLELSSGKLDLIKDSYSTRGIEPYIYFLVGNAMIKLNSKKAMHYFDHVRLISPGTMLEEMSLRNLLAIALNYGMEDSAFGYIRDYTRQFHHSIYKKQFISLLSWFFVFHRIELQEEDIIFTLSFFDLEDQRDIYFTIARYSAISCNRKMGLLAIKKLKGMYKQLDYRDIAAIWLYEDLLSVTFVNIAALQRSIYNIPDNFLMQQDMVLKKALEVILADMQQSLIEENIEFLDKNLILEKDQKIKSNFNLESFIDKNLKKVALIDSILNERE
ncbi:MAG: chemotaxis protein [Candidatus Liberibacter europaeus]|nr:chemotaxis protein [Candidatus Liberibacter europaeus]